MTLPSDPRDDGRRAISLRTRVRIAVAAVLAIGLAAAAFARVWATDDAELALLHDLDRFKAQEGQLERIGGRFATESVRLQYWFDGLWQGRQLSVTLVVITVVVAAAIMWIGHLASDGTDD